MKIKIYHMVLNDRERKNRVYGEILWFQNHPKGLGNIKGFHVNPYVTKSTFINYKEWYFDGEKFTFYGSIS